MWFGGVGLAWYRDGNDSVAFHRDTDLRYCENTVIAILTLGARRPWTLQPRGGRDRFDEGIAAGTIDLSPAGGDLLVMGGRAQTNVGCGKSRIDFDDEVFATVGIAAED